jgi:hypothetical protein
VELPQFVEQGASDPEVLANLVRYELLAPVLVARIAVASIGAFDAGEEIPRPIKLRREIASLLFLFTVVYWIVVGRTPFIWERYFISLSPVLTVIFLLDVFTLWDLVRRPSRAPGWLPGVAAIAVAICFGASAWSRVPEFRGRIFEITNRFQGPLDFVIPYLLEQYDRPDELVIATNYEDPVFMYYLGSHVTVGYYGANLPDDLEVQPDVIVPRPWDRNLPALWTLAERANYQIRQFPVQNLMTNNIPALSPRNPAGLVHFFETPTATGSEPVFQILERIDD